MVKIGKNLSQTINQLLFNILYVPYNTEKIGHAYKHISQNIIENQVILLMITDGEK